MEEIKKIKNPLSWIPFLYFAQGMPYFIVNSLSTILYKDLGINNAENTFWTGLLYLPWVLKPLWSPVVDLNSTKKRWFLAMQFLMALLILIIGLTIKMDNFMIFSLAVFMIIAVVSATNDIATDGFYMLGVPQNLQSKYIGFTGTFYKVAKVTVEGLIIIIAGVLIEKHYEIKNAWSITLYVAATVMLILCIVNFFSTPKVVENFSVKEKENLSFLKVFVTFFKKENIAVYVSYILLFRLGESQVLKIIPLFLKDSFASGGLGLSTKEFGELYGIIGMISLIIGGILGGIAISKGGLKKWIFPMALIMNMPNILFYILSIYQPISHVPVIFVIIIEQFGYGFGVASFFMFMIYIAQGMSKTSHYAMATGFMAMGMMLPGMASGFIQSHLGYSNTFLIGIFGGIPALFLIRFLKIPENFGKEIPKVNE